ncbi:MAG: DNA polymerase III subunit alpha [Alphaproteobacteria bacterium]|nr:DNA polymerase III subunit alpha [Alphaproteobacteria bacterium]TAD88442.1 MAG: DNA polymerase III subunit alpha [Alphaproteobacteria bacterium]
MPHASFVHLRLHSAYSLSEGAVRIKELVKTCAKEGMPAVAITDTGNLFGAIEFRLAALDAGVQPIIGCQLAIRRSDQPSRPGLVPEPDCLVLLVQSALGYANLMHLVSTAFLGSAAHESPQIGWEALEGHSDGLIALTGGPMGTVGRLLRDGNRTAAEAVLDRLQGLFPTRLYVELMRHDLPEEDAIEGDLIDLAYARDLPLVATNDVYFDKASMFEAHDALLCIAGGVTLSRQDRRRVTPEHRLKTAEEMRHLFADLPEACDNTLVIAQRCAYLPELRKPILPAFPTRDGRTEVDELRAMAAEGLERRLEGQSVDRATYEARLSFELDVIIKMGFAGYFLIVADFIQWAKAAGIPVGPGRGSGAGSLVAWALTITDLDPIRFGLLFERFLNPERVSMPDFDIDFCQTRRDEVIDYVQKKYGVDRVAQIITFGKLQARAVLRDVGRVMEMPYGQVDRICKLVPNNPANPVTLEQAVAGEPLLQQMRDSDEQVKRLIDTGMRLEGLYRHASTHAAGVVIGDRPLEQLVPLYRDPRSTLPATQFNMKYVEMAGLVKFDFLGLKTLTVLAVAEQLIRAKDPGFDLGRIPLDDAKTFDMLSRGDATGVFQLESSGMRDTVRKLKPDRLEDIIALVSLYRPGPMDNIPSYIARKKGEEEPDYLHPKLKGILEETYGIMIYQEQVMQIAQVLSGYSLGGADLLRRAMGKKIKEEMDQQRALFVDGAVKNGVDGAKASEIFDLVAKFAGYGFNKSHAAAYALVSYQTAWCKANHPVEFIAASMTLDIANTDKLAVFRQELTRLKIPLLPPDINASDVTFSVETTAEGVAAVRYALAAVKKVGEQAMTSVVAERRKGGRFKSVWDFAGRMDHRVVNKGALEHLIAAGAFDSLNRSRAKLFAAAETMVRFAAQAQEERASAQVSMFGGAVEAREPELPRAQEWPVHEALQREHAALGFYLTAHPLDAYQRVIDRLGIVRAADLPSKVRGSGVQMVQIAGIVSGRQERTSAKGNRFAFVQLSDQSGSLEVAMFSEVLSTARPLLDSGEPLLIQAKAEPDADGEGVRLTVVSVGSLETAAKGTGAGMKIYLESAAPLPGLKEVFAGKGSPPGAGPIVFVIDVDQREVEIRLDRKVPVSPALRQRVKAMPGVVDAVEI